VELFDPVSTWAFIIFIIITIITHENFPFSMKHSETRTRALPPEEADTNTHLQTSESVSSFLNHLLNK
jgi:hypothetical protein